MHPFTQATRLSERASPLVLPSTSLNARAGNFRPAERHFALPAEPIHLSLAAHAVRSIFLRATNPPTATSPVAKKIMLIGSGVGVSSTASSQVPGAANGV